MPMKERSPRYPGIDLATAITLTRALYDKHGRTMVPAEVVGRAWGYKGASGPMRSKLGALKAFGLVAGQGDKVQVSARALTLLLRAQESSEYSMALREAALDPPIFEELSRSHMEAGPDALQHHLVAERGFTNEGAKRLAETFRQTMALAGLAGAEHGAPAGEDAGNVVVHAEPATATIRVVPATVTVQNVYRWPLGRGLSAEVILSGGQPTADHIKRLRRHLELIEEDLQADNAGGAAE